MKHSGGFSIDGSASLLSCPVLRIKRKKSRSESDYFDKGTQN
jgi:hypothetical protein